MRYLVLLLILFILGCSSINEGIVTKKKYTPAYTTIVPMYVNNGMMMIPQYHPETYVVHIESAEETGYCYISKDEFDKVKINDYFKC